jgi:hypothetical protein
MVIYVFCATFTTNTEILVFGAKISSCCGFLQKKPQQVVLRAKTS